MALRIHRMLLVAVMFAAAVARADDVPVSLQLQLLSKMTTAIPAMQPVDAPSIKVLVVTPGSASSPSRGAQAAISAVRQIGKFGAYDTDPKLVTFTDASSFKATLQTEKPRIVYVAPELDEKSVAAIVEATSDSAVLTVSGVRDQVRMGIILGFELTEARPVVLVNLKQARRVNLDFKNQFLTHTTIVEK